MTIGIIFSTCLHRSLHSVLSQSVTRAKSEHLSDIAASQEDNNVIMIMTDNGKC